MKKFLMLFTVMMLCISMCSCGKSENAANSGETAVAENAVETTETPMQTEPPVQKDWILDYYVDDFNEPTSDWFVWLESGANGTFSNSAVTDARLAVNLLVDKESVDILKQYYALLFSTRYYTEGVPGTIIDAYAAGVPVISSKWESFSDVIEDGVTGFGYEFGNFEDLKVKIKQAIEQQSVWMGLKNNCLKRANDFTPKEAMKILFEKLEV